jgi:sugar lactone lactonase YvrE
MRNLLLALGVVLTTSCSLLVDVGGLTGGEPSDAASGDAGSGDAASEAGPGSDAASGSPGAPSGVAAAAATVVTTVSTVAGSVLGAGGFADGTGATAKFFEPNGLAVDAIGNVYVADTANHRIRKVTSAGVVTTLAGSGSATFADGVGAGASFFIPLGVTVDAGRNVYVADGGNNRIRKVTSAGVVSTLAGSGSAAFADGTGAAASFSGPGAVAVDGLDNVYVVDQTNQRIRLVTPAGVVTTLAGSGTAAFADGTGAAASFDYPGALAMAGGDLWVSDSSNHRIRKVTVAGVVTTLAGSDTFSPFADGTGAAARFSSPQGIAVDAAGNAYVADQNYHRIRKMTPAGVVTTLAGSGTASFNDGAAGIAEFNTPAGVAVDADDNVYVSDKNNNRIRKIVSVGLRQIVVTWRAPSAAGSSAIDGYTATASAPGEVTRTCTTTGATTCTISGLTSGVAYSVSVTATNASGTSVPSDSASATPN